MYRVSKQCLDALAQTNCEFKIAVRFKYKDDSQAEFDDHNILGNPRIESQAVSGGSSCSTIDIGAVPAAIASLTVIDDNTDLHRYAGAEFDIYVYVKLDRGGHMEIPEYEEIPMGKFFVESSKTERIGNQISIFGYDAMVSLMGDISNKSSINGKTAHEAVVALLKQTGVACGFRQSFTGFPNSDMALDFSSSQIVTIRDAIMWIAQIMGCFARINRQNNLEFVPIKSDWEYYDDDHTSGTIIAARTLNETVRYNTRFSDDRIHIVGITTLGSSGQRLTIQRKGLDSDANVIINMEQNPLITSSTSTADILNAIVDQLSTTYFYAFRSEIRNDPTIDAGDTIRLTGGVINGTNRNDDLVGFITHNIWEYKNRHEVINTGQTVINYDAFAGTASNIVPSQSQYEKAIHHSLNKLNIAPEWVGEQGNVGIRVYGVSTSTEDEQTAIINGYPGTAFKNKRTGKGAELQAKIKDDSASPYATLLFSSTHMKIQSNQTWDKQYPYEVSIGSQLMKFVDAIHSIGFTYERNLNDNSQLDGATIKLFFGDNNHPVEIFRSSSLVFGDTLEIKGIQKIKINGKMVIDLDTETP